jgi:phosphatidylinositol-3-phosphatase
MQHWGLTPLLHRLVGAALVVVALAGACKHGGGPPGHPTAAGHPCTGAAPPARYEHVVTIVMENHGFSQVAGHSPFLNTLARRCGLATAYRAVTHPSLPNYLALVSGSTQGLDGSDCSPGAGCQSSGESIFSQTGWKAYAESMPGSCGPKNAGDYAPRHNPAVYFTKVAAACAKSDVPLEQLQPDLQSGDLAPYTFITPNLCSDEHDCQISDGDRWLARWVPRIIRSPAYRDGTTALFITYDEDDHAEDNRVYTVVVAPSVRPGTLAGDAFTHYSLLRTQEELLGLPLLGQAAAAPSMRAAFGLE